MHMQNLVKTRRTLSLTLYHTHLQTGNIPGIHEIMALRIPVQRRLGRQERAHFQEAVAARSHWELGRMSIRASEPTKNTSKRGSAASAASCMAPTARTNSFSPLRASSRLKNASRHTAFSPPPCTARGRAHQFKPACVSSSGRHCPGCFTIAHCVRLEKPDCMNSISPAQGYSRSPDVWKRPQPRKFVCNSLDGCIYRSMELVKIRPG